MNNLTVIIPFYNGQQYIDKLILSLPSDIPVIIVDDLSDEVLYNRWSPQTVKVIRLEKKGYFAGAVNRGLQECETDVLVLNQDTWFDGDAFFRDIDALRTDYAFFGERVRGSHPAFGDLVYVHGTCMFMRRDAIQVVGELNERDYPLWGCTAEYQWRVARKNFKILSLKEIPGFHHVRAENQAYGSSIQTLLKQEVQKRSLLVRTPPLVSVIVPCFNYGRYLGDCLASLIGGSSSLGDIPGQTLQSFEVIIVNDASTDDSLEIIKKLADANKGVRAYNLSKNVGTAKALNYGIERAVGKYITFLSADDMREPDSLEKLVRACEQNPHSFVYDDIQIFYGHKKIKKWDIEEYNFETLLYKNQIHAGILYPRQAWVEAGGYPPSMNDGREDWAFNIALGIQGYCGVHVKNYGYLYRREGQNRTERNTTEAHRARFLAKVMDIFPRIYKGERPVACCGRGGSNSRKNVGVNTMIQMRMSSNNSNLIGSSGMEKIEYQGQQMSFTISGDVTNEKYTFGKDRPRGWVDKRDLGSRDSGRGFLGKRDRLTGQWLYKVAAKDANEIAEESIVEEEVVVEPVLEQEASGAVGASELGGILSVGAGPVVTDFPNPKDLTVNEIKALDLSREAWEQVYKSELANLNRKGAVVFLEELLANWSESQ